MTMSQLHEVIRTSVDDRRRTIICSLNLHGAALARRDPIMRSFHRDTLVRIDGMPVILWARVLGYHVGREHRVTWVDWMPEFLRHATDHEWRVAYVGSSELVLDKGVSWVERHFPRLRFAAHHGYFDLGKGGTKVVEWVNGVDPDVVLVGMGMPRQEHWIRNHAHEIEAPVLLTCGAAMDYFAGAVRRPPRWLGRFGLEWLARLAAEPGRLWRRYVIEPWALLPELRSDLRRTRLSGRRPRA